MEITSYIRKYGINEDKLKFMLPVIEKVNPITYSYFIERSYMLENIILSKIIGINQKGNKSFEQLLYEYYSADKPEYDYFSRCNGLLKYSPDKLIDILYKSLSNGSIKIRQVDLNQFCIDTNGIHRFLILKLAYIYDKNKGNLSTEELNQKYTIPVTVRKCDFIKSYCYFLLDNYSSVQISLSLDSSSEFTQYLCINGDSVHNNEKLIALCLEKVDFNNPEILFFMKKIDSFRIFMEQLRPDLNYNLKNINLSENELDEKIYRILHKNSMEMIETNLPDYIDAFSFFGDPFESDNSNLTEAKK